MNLGGFKQAIIKLALGDDEAGSRIGPGGRCLLTLHGLFTLGIGLSGVFVNVYFWRLDAGLASIAIFNLVQFFALPVAFVLAGYLSSMYKDRVISLQIGIVIHIIMFALILILREDSVRFLYLLGLLGGVGAGFFYLAINVLIFDLTDQTSVDRFNGLNGFVLGVANVISPFVAGVVISLFPKLIGFRVVFALTLSLFIACIVLSKTFWTRKLEHEYLLALPFSDQKYLGILFSALFLGIRTGAFSFLIGLLVFILSSEFILGVFSSITAGFLLGAGYLGGRWINKGNRAHFVLIAVMLFLTASTFAAIEVSLFTLFLLGTLDSWATPFFDITFQARTFWAIERLGERHRVEYLVGREIALNLGRVIGIILLLLLVSQDLSLPRIRLFFAVITPSAIALGWGITKWQI